MSNDKQPVTDKQLISVSPEQLEKMIADGVLNVMSQLKDAETQRPVQDIDYEKLGSAIGDAVSKGIAATQRPKVTVGQYVRRPYSVFHTEGKGDHARPKLTRTCWQNDSWLNPDRLMDSEIRLLNRITHSGRYINRMVEVVVLPNGAEDEVFVRFHNSTHDQRFELKGYVRNFEDMLTQIVEKQEEEDRIKALETAHREELRARAQRPHFGGAATRDAQAAAAKE